MTRFVKGHGYTTKAGKSLSVFARDELGCNLLSRYVRRDLETALKLLESTDAQLHAHRHSKELLRYANEFFLTDKNRIAANDLKTIQTVVAQVWTGLSGDVTIKVGANVGRGDTSVYGAVAKQEGNHSWRSDHTLVASLDDGKMYTRGTMRIGENALLGGRIGVVTVIHEATHKYAGTIDYCYMDDDDQSPGGAFDDKSQALINADSYGWFVLKVGRSSTQRWLHG